MMKDNKLKITDMLNKLKSKIESKGHKGFIRVCSVVLIGTCCTAGLLVALKSLKSESQPETGSDTDISLLEINTDMPEEAASDEAELDETEDGKDEESEEDKTEEKSDEEKINEAVESEEAQIQASTGNVTTAPEFQYDGSEDINAGNKDVDVSIDNGSGSISNIVESGNAQVKPVITKPQQEANKNETSGADKTDNVSGGAANNSSGASNNSGASSQKPESTKPEQEANKNEVSGTDKTDNSATSAQKPESTKPEADSSQEGATSPETQKPSEPSEESGESSDQTEIVISDGWLQDGNEKYYYSQNKKLTGWQDIGGARYYFNENGVLSSMRGIDVSSYQGNIDWKKVKDSGIDFAFIRIGYRGYETGRLVLDPNFEKNIRGAQSVGIKCGVYFYSVAANELEGAQEANFVLEALKGYNLELPVVVDVEHHTHRVAGLSAEQRTNNTIAFLKTIQQNGRAAMLYTGYYYYNNRLQPSRLAAYKLWIAYYTNNPNNVSGVPYDYWQYSDKGQVSGINGNVDLNVFIKR